MKSQEELQRAKQEFENCILEQYKSIQELRDKYTDIPIPANVRRIIASIKKQAEKYEHYVELLEIILNSKQSTITYGNPPKI